MNTNNQKISQENINESSCKETRRTAKKVRDFTCKCSDFIIKVLEILTLNPEKVDIREN